MVDGASVDDEQMSSILSSLTALHRTYLSASSPSHISLSPDPSPSLDAALSPALSPAQQWACLRDTRLVQQVYLQVFQVLEEIYYPQYCQSEQVGLIPMITYSHSPIPMFYALQFYSKVLLQQTNGLRGGRMERGHTPRMEWSSEKRRGRGLSHLSTRSLEDLNSDSRSEVLCMM